MRIFSSNFFGICLLGMSLVLGGSVLTGCKKEPKETTPVLRVVSSVDYVPYEFYRNAEIVGFDIDLVKAIAEKLKYTVEIKDLPFESILASLQSNQADLAISSISNTEERRKSVDFSNNYHANGPCLVLLENDESVSLQETKGKTVGVQAGSTHEIFVKEGHGKAYQWTLRAMEKIPDLVQDLKAGRIFGALMGEEEATGLIETYPGLKKLSIPGEKVSMAIAFPKGSPLVARVNEAIKELEENGTLEVLQKKWLRH